MDTKVALYTPSKVAAADAVFSCRFRHGQLVEVNAHSLFSKWFSESGKLVSRLFAKIMELVSIAQQHRRMLQSL